ncbi:MAG TPA: MMPL family transporter [Solirubrobacteraceae bacterium]|nr:MMPL family transporter [Solirubrobacteraceae bacterium]
MRLKERLEALVRAATRKPPITVGIVLVLALAGGLLALGLKPSAATDTFVSKSSSSYQATQADYRHFGGDAVVILLREPLPDLVETSDLGNLVEMEGCLAGQHLIPNQGQTAFITAPASQGPIGGRSGPCARLARLHAVQVVYGPGTFLNRSVLAIGQGLSQLLGSVKTAADQKAAQAYQAALKHGSSKAAALKIANQAGQLEQQAQEQQLETLAAQSGLGLSDSPAIDNSSFISAVVFDPTRGVNQPKGRFAYLFPTADSALVQVRLKSSLSTSEQARVITLIRQIVKQPMFRLGHGGRYTVSGEPVVVSDLTSQITNSIFVLLIAAMAVMAVTLLLVFRRRLRLLPLAIALAAAGITFGVIALIGATLTMASIAVLPILIGLGVDYAIQFQSRAQEAIRDGDATSPAQAVVRAAGIGGPTIAVAALATATGFLVLLLSPVPMVRGFGLLLVLGIAVALACTLIGGSAAQVLLAGARRRGAAGRRSLGRIERALGPSLRGAGEILSEAWRALPRRGPRVGAGGVPTRPRRLTSPGAGRAGRVIGAVVRRPGWVLALGAVLAVLGWVADTQTSVQSDLTKLVPKSMPALRDLNELERVTGTSGELDVTVHATDVATARVINWMSAYENRLLTHYGYIEEKGCAHATLCPALSLPDLFSQGTATGSTSTKNLSTADITSLLDAVPPYFKQAVITGDRQNATLAFGIRLMPLAKQQRVIDYMRSQLHPPAGVTAQLAGLPVLAAQANQALSSSSRRLLTLLAGLLAVGLVLLAVFRSARRALVPLVPIALATGWSALILWLIGIPLNPMSATLGALVIAISTEFSVLLSERFRQEQAQDAPMLAALQRTYRSTGAAVLASGITAIAGFGVLIFSNITMLRDFGFVTLIDLTVSLLGVLLVLPAVLALAERRGVVPSGRALRGRFGGSMPPKLRRRARIAS